MATSASDRRCWECARRRGAVVRISAGRYGRRSAGAGSRGHLRGPAPRDLPAAIQLEDKSDVAAPAPDGGADGAEGHGRSDELDVALAWHHQVRQSKKDALKRRMWRGERAHLALAVQLQVVLRLQVWGPDLLCLWLEPLSNVREDLARAQHAVRVETLGAVVICC